jgi:hypothetical protein
MYDLIPAAGALAPSQEGADLFARLLGQRPAATLKAWRDDWKHFAAWCAAAGRAALPASPGTVAAFIEAETRAPRPDRGTGYAPATVERRVATVVKAHAIAGHANPTKDELVQEALKGNARRGEDEHQAKGLDQETTTLAQGRLQGSIALKDLRGAAMVMVGRDLLTRAGELVSIMWGAIRWNEGGSAVVTMRWFKTSNRSTMHPLSPAAASVLKRWLDGRGSRTRAPRCSSHSPRPARNPGARADTQRARP